MPRCKLKNCPYDRDGRCVENQLPNCPNLLPDEPANPVAQEAKSLDTKATPTLPQHEALYSGKKLTADQATQILQSHPAQVVVLGGMVESGKTTLLARIFEMFQCKCVAGHRFTASQTLVGFDQLSWHSTMECGAANPTTEHTSRSENNLFLHLRVQPEDGSAPAIDLLVADIPGEIFPEAVAEESVLRNLCALARADHLVLFLDGEVLCDPMNRHDPCGKVFDFVHYALQTKQIGQRTVLHLVISKCDLLPKDGTSDPLKYIESTEGNFRAKFHAHFSDVLCWRLAARPEAPEEPTFENINKIFGVWMSRCFKQPENPRQTPQRSGFSRDFCRFGL